MKTFGMGEKEDKMSAVVAAIELRRKQDGSR